MKGNSLKDDERGLGGGQCWESGAQITGSLAPLMNGSISDLRALGPIVYVGEPPLADRTSILQPQLLTISIYTNAFLVYLYDAHRCK